MNLVRFLAATVVAWLIIALGGAVWHEILFADQYNAWTVGIERIQMPIEYFVVSHFIRALAYVYVYYMLYKGGTPLVKGLKFGFLMGIITGVTVTSYYGDFLITSPGWVLAEFAYNIVRAMSVGVTTAFIIGERQQ